MAKTTLLFGFDTESPYGPKARTDEGDRERKANHDLTIRINELMNAYSAGRTFFILGDYFLRALEAEGTAGMNEVFEPSNPLVEIGQHTMSHAAIAPIATRPDKVPVSSADLLEELLLTTHLLEGEFRVPVIGLRAPLGYAGGVPEDIAQTISTSGLFYTSSDLRDKKWGICPPFKEDGVARQPRRYSSGLIEIPSHGWQDTAFTGESKTIGTEGYPTTPAKILLHYVRIINEARKHADDSGEDTYVGLCMHQWAMKKYDPELFVLNKILEYASRREVSCEPYRAVLRDPRFAPVDKWSSLTQLGQ
jgi:hypothetical protein